MNAMEINGFFGGVKDVPQELSDAADVVVRSVCGLKKGERFLIVTNPEKDTLIISMALYNAVLCAGGIPLLIFQETKTQFDFADEGVIGALEKEPAVFASVSYNKLGKDRNAGAVPLKGLDGHGYDHIFDFNLYGKKTMRAFWSPGVTLDMFVRTACIDYDLLKLRCQKLIKRFAGAVSVCITAPAGTDITIPVQGRIAFADDGDFTRAGTGGNIPAGEVYISPVVGQSEGVIVYDGSMSLKDFDILIHDPIRVVLEHGFVTSVTGKHEAELLEETLCAGETAALNFEKEGKLPAGQGALYKRNARNLGELGIGLNPNALITGQMLEDEKAFRTCHFAIGSNYDDDAPSMIHLDGVVREPTIIISYADGTTFTAEKNGELAEELRS